jgi:hypothetical protein
MASAGTKFVFECSETAKQCLLHDGFDVRYGARHLKRAIERMLVSPLSNLVASEQVGFGDLVYVDVDPETGRFTFAKRSAGVLVCETADLGPQAETSDPAYVGMGMHIPVIQAASLLGY